MAEHPRFFYNEIAFLLALAFADSASIGVSLLVELWDLEFPHGEGKIPLLWTASVIDKPILRTIGPPSVTEEPMNQSAFSRIFSTTVKNVGYSCSVTIHAIRQNLGHEVDSKLAARDEIQLTDDQRSTPRSSDLNT